MKVMWNGADDQHPNTKQPNTNRTTILGNHSNRPEAQTQDIDGIKQVQEVQEAVIEMLVRFPRCVLLFCLCFFLCQFVELAVPHLKHEALDHPLALCQKKRKH